jgi:hypothetical protein
MHRPDRYASLVGNQTNKDKGAYPHIQHPFDLFFNSLLPFIYFLFSLTIKRVVYLKRQMDDDQLFAFGASNSSKELALIDHTVLFPPRSWTS